MDLLPVARRLYGMGFNVVPVTGDKKPLVTWSAEERRDFKELEKYFTKAEGVAVTGLRLWTTSDYGLIIIDVDDIEAGEKVLSQVFGDWKSRLCGQDWSFCGLSGPRPKGYWQCRSDGKCIGKNGEEKDISELQRGMYAVIRVPSICAPRNSIRGSINNVRAIELLIDNYQVVYGKHPSGALYQPAKWNDGKWVPVDINEVGEGEVITCSELNRLLTFISSLNGDEGRSPEEVSELGEATGSLPEPVRHLDEDAKNTVIQFMKALWQIDNNGVRNHDYTIFGVASLARRAGVSKMDVLAMLDEICAFAMANGLDNDKTCKEHRDVVEWIYKDRPGKRIWGRRTFEQTLRPALSKVVPNVDIALSELYEALGYQADAPLCIPITSNTEYSDKGSDSRRRITEWICNDPRMGIIKRSITRRHRRNEDGDEEVNVRVEKKLLPFFLSSVSVYSDVVFDIKYFSINAINVETNEPLSFTMAMLDEVVNQLNKHTVTRSPNWSVILDKWKATVRDVIISGFVCAPHIGVECKVRDYFNVGIGIEPDPGKAKAIIEGLINTVKLLHPEPDAWLTALAYSLFTSFTLTRKLHGVKSMITALIGVRDSGKTTAANLAAKMLNPNINLLMSSSTTLTPARIGRLAGITKVVTTGPIILDEGGRAGTGGYIEISGDVEQVLKSYVAPDQLYSWQTATGLRFPAASGIVITANELKITNPAMEEKVAKVKFSKPIDKASMEKFNAWFLSNAGDLRHFGAYYLKYAEKNWSSIADTILSPDWLKSAAEYFNMILSSLGVEPVGLILDAPSSSYRERLRIILDEVVQAYSASQCRDITYDLCLKTLAKNFYIPWLRYSEDNGLYIILPSFEKYSGIPPKAICNEIPNASVDTKTTRNPKYYGRCIIPEESFYEYLNLSQPAPADDDNDEE